jgi:hypothetical protein
LHIHERDFDNVSSEHSAALGGACLASIDNLNEILRATPVFAANRRPLLNHPVGMDEITGGSPYGASTLAKRTLAAAELYTPIFRPRPNGFIEPCLPSPAQRPPVGPDACSRVAGAYDFQGAAKIAKLTGGTNGKPNLFYL